MRDYKMNLDKLENTGYEMTQIIGQEKGGKYQRQEG